jgi:hypothetical protein
LAKVQKADTSASQVADGDNSKTMGQCDTAVTETQEALRLEVEQPL